MSQRQGRRRFLKSGTAIGVHRVPKAGLGESTRGGLTPSRKGGLGDLPRENFQIQDVCRSDSEAIFACEIRLIVQTLHGAVFKLVSNPTTKV